MRSVTYSMAVSLDGYVVGRTPPSTGRRPTRRSFTTREFAVVYPVLVGGGIPFFPQREHRVDLELVESRAFSPRVAHLRYRAPR